MKTIRYHCRPNYNEHYGQMVALRLRDDRDVQIKPELFDLIAGNKLRRDYKCVISRWNTYVMSGISRLIVVIADLASSSNYWADVT